VGPVDGVGVAVGDGVGAGVGVGVGVGFGLGAELDSGGGVVVRCTGVTRPVFATGSGRTST
jgi:hypothetical protein